MTQKYLALGIWDFNCITRYRTLININIYIYKSRNLVLAALGIFLGWCVGSLFYIKKNSTQTQVKEQGSWA